MRRSGTLAIVVGAKTTVMFDGVSATAIATETGVPDSLQLGRAFRGRQAVVAVSPSFAQVRRVGGLAADLSDADARRLVEQNMEDAFVGAVGSLTLMQVARIDDALWAWAVSTSWHQTFLSTLYACGMRVRVMLPLSRVWSPPPQASGMFMTCVDEAGASMVLVSDGKITHEWRVHPATHDAARAREGTIRLEDAASKVVNAAEVSSLSVPSPAWRAAHRRRRALMAPILVGIVAFALTAVVPLALQQQALRELRAEHQRLTGETAQSTNALRLLGIVHAVNELRARDAHGAAPVLAVLGALSRASGGDSRVLSLRVDSAKVTLVATVASSSALVDTLAASGLFSDVRIAGEITRVGDDAPVAHVQRAGLPRTETDVMGDEGHRERVTIIGILRADGPTGTASGRSPLTPLSSAAALPVRP